jgi:hypothetical protein
MTTMRVGSPGLAVAPRLATPRLIAPGLSTPGLTVGVSVHNHSSRVFVTESRCAASSCQALAPGRRSDNAYSVGYRAGVLAGRES